MVVLFLMWLFGVSINEAPQPSGNRVAVISSPAESHDEDSRFVAVMLRDTEDVWSDLFQRTGRVYQKPVLVLYSGEIQSGCGLAMSDGGPFYCPDDKRLYLDLGFYRELRDEFGAPGDFAQAYVIAHEVGHHVQNQLGLTRQEASSIQLELQADFLAGVWAHHAQERWKFLQRGDVEEALVCAAAIGDDRLQIQSQGYVTPERFTHGTSEQRVKWFKKGLASGKLEDGKLEDIR